MNKFFTLLFLGTIAFTARAQTAPSTQPYGKIDQADLEMKACDFEKDANAEVLFNKGNLYYGDDLKSIVIESHKRIKIFNENGNKEANIQIPYEGGDHKEYINGIEAETINLVDGKVEITKLDKKLIYNKVIDKWHSEVTFAMPNIKPGCIIEYKYKWNANYNAAIPYWDFQERIPVRYSELATSIPDVFYFRPDPRMHQPLIRHTVATDTKVMKVLTHTFDTGGTGNGATGTQDSETFTYNVENEVRGMANIASLPQEPYMSSFADNVQSIGLNLVSVKPINGFNSTLSDTWAKVGGILADDEDFGDQLKRSLNKERDIINTASGLKTGDEKIAYIFNEVKNGMKWNGVDRWYTIDGTSKAWDNKTGNSAEINLILYHLLKQSGINAYPMVVGTRDYGKVSRYNTSTIEFNRAVVYVPVDSIKYYVLDATGKYNLYNETPAELLNSLGLYIDKSKKLFDTVYLKNDLSVRQIVMINGNIKADGKLDGTAQLVSFGYNKVNTVKNYKENGEKKYMDNLSDGDNNLKISAVKFEGMDVDTLPLTQKVDFNLDLVGSDGNYIYLNPNLFTSLKKNLFLSDKRMTDIDFGYLQNYSINGTYKMPPGYKIDVLPKTVTIIMPDRSITFKRIIQEQDGDIIVRYSINYTKAEYSKDNYSDFHEFYKKMYELLNEQIVLKKS